MHLPSQPQLDKICESPSWSTLETVPEIFQCPFMWINLKKCIFNNINGKGRFNIFLKIGWVAICRLAMCQITICQQKSIVLTDRTKTHDLSKIYPNVITRRKWCRPLGRGSFGARYCSQNFTCPSLQYCGHCTSLKNF